MSAPRHRAPLGTRLVASTLVLLVVALVAEGVARLVAPEAPTWRGADTGAVVMVGHPTRLWGMGPGVRQNAGTIATIAPIGLRAPLPDGPRPAGRERVLVLGDSTYFGHGVADDATLEAHLQARLRGDGLDVEVLNGGVPGYSTEQTRLLLDEVGWGLEPTLLVLGNVWSDNNFDHFRDADLLRTSAAFARNPLARSAFFQLLAGAVDRLRGGEGAHLVTWTRRSAFPAEGVRRVPLRRYAENLDAMVRAAAARGVGVALLTPANVGMVEGTAPRPTSWDPYFEAQAAVARHHGVPRIEALPALAAAAATGGAGALFIDDMHPSAAGHARIAEALADTLHAAGWPDARLLGHAEPFDASGLRDVGEHEFDRTASPQSPQTNLFRDASPSGGRGPARAPDRGGASAGARVAWEVAGRVTAAGGPVRVEIRRPSGEPLGVVLLAAPGAFRVPVRGDQERVVVVASDARGREVRAEAERGASTLALAIP